MPGTFSDHLSAMTEPGTLMTPLQPPFAISDLRHLLRTAVNPEKIDLASIEDLFALTEKICGPLPEATRLRRTVSGKGLRSLHLEVDTFPAHTAGDETDVLELAKSLGDELDDPNLTSGQIPPDLLPILRTWALLNVRPTYRKQVSASLEQEVTPEQEQHIDQMQTHQMLTTVLLELKPREERILRMRYGIGVEEHTLQQVGDLFGLTRQRVDQIEHKALIKCLKLMKRTKQHHQFLHAWSNPPKLAASNEGDLDRNALKGRVGNATLRLAEKLGVTPVELIPLFHEIDLCIEVPVRQDNDPDYLTALESHSIETASKKVLNVKFPGTLNHNEMAFRIGCSDEVLNGFIDEGHLRPVMKANGFGLGDRFSSFDATKILKRYGSLFYEQKTQTRSMRMSMKGAAEFLGYAERDIALHVLTHPELVTSMTPNSDYRSVWVDIARLSDSIAPTDRVRSGPDRYSQMMSGIMSSEQFYQTTMKKDNARKAKATRPSARQEQEPRAKLSLHVTRESPPTVPRTEPASTPGVSIQGFSANACLSVPAVRHFMIIEHLRSKQRSHIDHADAQNFLRLYVSSEEIAMKWPNGEQILSILHAARVPPVFSTKETGMEIYLRDYVAKIAKAMSN